VLDRLQLVATQKPTRPFVDAKAPAARTEPLSTAPPGRSGSGNPIRCARGPARQRRVPQRHLHLRRFPRFLASCLGQQRMGCGRQQVRGSDGGLRRRRGRTPASGDRSSDPRTERGAATRDGRRAPVRSSGRVAGAPRHARAARIAGRSRHLRVRSGGDRAQDGDSTHRPARLAGLLGRVSRRDVRGALGHRSRIRKAGSAP
jgi:hypothetical protein